MKNETKRLFSTLQARNGRRLYAGSAVGNRSGASMTPTTYYACVNMTNGLI